MQVASPTSYGVAVSAFGIHSAARLRIRTGGIPLNTSNLAGTEALPAFDFIAGGTQ